MTQAVYTKVVVANPSFDRTDQLTRPVEKEGINPSIFKGPQLPVEQLSWDDANTYCQTVGMRLPTSGRNGNTRREEAARHRLTGNSMRFLGMKITATARVTPSPRSNRTPSDCTICSGTFGNGSRIGMGPIARRRW